MQSDRTEVYLTIPVIEFTQHVQIHRAEVTLPGMYMHVAEYMVTLAARPAQVDWVSLSDFYQEYIDHPLSPKGHPAYANILNAILSMVEQGLLEENKQDGYFLKITQKLADVVNVARVQVI